MVAVRRRRGLQHATLRRPCASPCRQDGHPFKLHTSTKQATNHIQYTQLIQNIQLTHQTRCRFHCASEWRARLAQMAAAQFSQPPPRRGKAGKVRRKNGTRSGLAATGNYRTRSSLSKRGLQCGNNAVEGLTQRPGLVRSSARSSAGQAC